MGGSLLGVPLDPQCVEDPVPHPCVFGPLGTECSPVESLEIKVPSTLLWGPFGVQASVY